MTRGSAARAETGDGTQSALAVLLSRSSVPPAKLGAPGPEGGDLEAILDAGLRAPDHGRLRPWRFAVIRGDARRALGEVFAHALTLRDPQATRAQIDRERARPQQAPLIIAAGASLRPDHAVPVTEQLLSSGAAVMNMLNAAHALGYGGMWLTGRNCYDPVVKDQLGFPDPDWLVGFLHLGTPMEPPSPVVRAERAAHSWDWPGPDRVRF